MNNKKSTKRTLLTSVLSLILCMAMLIGTTFAWFTDSVTSAGNTIQSGTLDVDLVDAAGNSMEGKVIEFITKDNRAQDAILWEPGCTYETEAVFVVNKGNLTNGKGTYAETVVNGGTVVSPYRAIRMFLNGVEAQNILIVNGGTIKGHNKSIWMQDPSKSANTGTLTVTEGASLIGDVNLTVTAGSTSWPVTVSINEKALKNGAEVLNSNVPEGYEVKLVDGCYVVAAN